MPKLATGPVEGSGADVIAATGEVARRIDVGEGLDDHLRFVIWEEGRRAEIVCTV